MHYRTGTILVMTAGFLWSWQALIIRHIEVASPWVVLTWRSLSMIPVLLLFLAWRKRGSPLPTILRSGQAGVIGGIGLVVAMGGAILAFQTTTIANAAFIFAASPFIAAILGRLFLAERVATRTWLAICLAILGIFFMVNDGLAAGALVGNIAAIMSAFGFAVFSVSLRWRKIEDSLPVALIGAVFAVIAGGIASLYSGQSLNIPFSDIMLCVLMGTVTMACGMLLYSIGSRVVPSAELTLMSNTEVILAPFWVWLILGETASMTTLLGGMIVLSALLFNAFSGITKPATATAL